MSTDHNFLCRKFAVYF